MNKEEVISAIDNMINTKPKDLVLNHLLISSDWANKIEDKIVNNKYKGYQVTSSEYVEKDKATITSAKIIKIFNESVNEYLKETEDGRRTKGK